LTNNLVLSAHGWAERSRLEFKAYSIVTRFDDWRASRRCRCQRLIRWTNRAQIR